MEDESLRKVGKLVASRRRELQMDQAGLARTADVDPKTVRAFERGERWPRERSRTRIEAALQWPAGSLERIKAGDIPFPIRLDREFFQSQNPGPDAERVIEEALAESDRRYAEKSAAAKQRVVAELGERPDYSPLIAGLAVDVDDLQAAALSIDTFIDTDDIDVGEVERLVSDTESLVLKVDDLAASVYDIARKIVGDAGRLQRLKRETRQFRKQQARIRRPSHKGRSAQAASPAVPASVDLTPNDGAPPAASDYELVARKESDPKEDPGE